MTRSPQFPYTPDHLAASRDELARAFPDAQPHFIAYALASEVIINVFGPEWWGTRLAGPRPDPYFLTNGVGPLSGYVHQHRVIQLGDDLLVCQHFEGFADQRSIMAKRSLAAVYQELHVARMLYNSDHDVAFVVPSGAKGRDFDLLVDGALATEVKAKEDETEYTRSSVTSTLSSARPQLPSGGPGLIVLRLPDTWGTNPTFGKEADDMFNGVLRNSRRINAIVLLWDEWLLGSPEGAACLTRFRVYENSNPRTDFADLPRVLRSILADGSLQNSEIAVPAGDCTLICAVRRHGGPGPLFESFDRSLQMIFDRAGFVANRVGGQVHVTSVPMEELNDRWSIIALRIRGSEVDLRVDDALIDSWTAPQQSYEGLRVMPDVDADLRETVMYGRGLDDEEVDQLFRYLANKSAGSYVQFRRGDVARYRVGNE